MNYCSECGCAVSLEWVPEDGRQRYLCGSCGVTHYDNPRVIVASLVCWRDRILMCQRSREPAYGQWILPSGFLECGETLQEGAARETFEEAGLIIDPADLHLYSVMNMTAIQQVAVAFRVQISGKPAEIRPGPECLKVAFLSEEDIPANQFAWFEALGSRPTRLFDELRSEDYTIQLLSIGTNDGTGFRSREYAIRGHHDYRQD
jgi:ADP-ribose pyrophosphatase YjhB (NUDIX family)